jgi:hypothetical protein
MWLVKKGGTGKLDTKRKQNMSARVVEQAVLSPAANANWIRKRKQTHV